MKLSPLRDARRRALLACLRRCGRLSLDAPLAGWSRRTLERAAEDLAAAGVAEIRADGSRVCVSRVDVLAGIDLGRAR